MLMLTHSTFSQEKYLKVIDGRKSIFGKSLLWFCIKSIVIIRHREPLSPPSYGSSVSPSPPPARHAVMQSAAVNMPQHKLTSLTVSPDWLFQTVLYSCFRMAAAMLRRMRWTMTTPPSGSTWARVSGRIKTMEPWATTALSDQHSMVSRVTERTWTMKHCQDLVLSVRRSLRSE